MIRYHVITRGTGAVCKMRPDSPSRSARNQFVATPLHLRGIVLREARLNAARFARRMLGLGGAEQ
jgi:hypothetical protein